LFSFCDDSRLEIRFNAAISFELYSSVEELLNDPCDPIVLGLRDCRGTRPEDEDDPEIALDTPLIIEIVFVDDACVTTDNDPDTWLQWRGRG
jgi:hypothetical protein